jgi:CII-binding regulator of phage lambda lysogenization HflD
MSVRSHSTAAKTTPQPSAAIEFKNEFVNSTAAFAASHDETVSHILHRLDQLQTKISTQPEPQQAVAPTRTPLASKAPTELHARLSALEDIHENALHRLGAKLEGVERKLSDTREAESLMGRIASKFTAIESQLNANKDSGELMTRIASKFSQVEAKLHAATKLADRVAMLESRALPDPEQERLLTRINAKLDHLEGAASKKKTLSTNVSMGAELGNEERIGYLRDRITKLNELKAKYEAEERNIMLQH